MNAFRPVNSGLQSERADRYDPESWGIAPAHVAPSTTPRPDDLAAKVQQADVVIGRDVGSNTWELLVSCLPADALQQQFDVRSPFFMVLHDLQGVASRRLLMDLAARLRLTLQRLVIKRQGFGTELASLYFLDVKASNGQSIRIYSSEAKADDLTRIHIRRVLIERCRMCVTIAPVLPQPEQDTSLIALAQTLAEGQSRARRVVFLPLVDTSTLAAGLAGFSRRVLMPVAIAPARLKPLESWPFIVANWNKLHAITDKPLKDQWLLDADCFDDPSVPTPSQPGDLQAMAGLNEGQLNALANYARDMSMQSGVESVSIFNVLTLQMVARAGSMSPEDDVVMKQGRALVATLQTLGGSMNVGKSLYECAVRYGQHHIWLRPIRSAPNMLMLVASKLDSPATLDWLGRESNRQDALLMGNFSRKI